MARLLVYYAHPGQKYSHANKAMVREALKVDGITFVDLYADYPRHNIDVQREQQRLRDHDFILFQFPLFWYSTPSLLKEWQDLVLEHGFAFGHEGDALEGKNMMLAVTTGGPQEAFRADGYQNHSLETFLIPLQQTATLCGMRYLPPYVLHASLTAPREGRVKPHAEGYRLLLEAIRDDLYDLDAAMQRDYVFSESLQDLIRSEHAKEKGGAHV